MTDNKPGYETAIRSLQEAQENGYGFLVCIDKPETQSIQGHQLSLNDLAQFFASILEDRPEVVPLVMAMKMMKEGKERNANVG